MTSARWERIKDIFDSALSLAAEARPSFLNGACEGQPELRLEIERLLRQHDSAGEFMLEPLVPSGSLADGEVVAGRYRIVRMLGRGGMGEVYEAHDQFLSEGVALKTLRADLSRNEDLIRRFQREIQLARRVTHPSVCRVFEVGVHEPSPGWSVRFFTMELLKGETLSARLHAQGRLTRAEAFGFAAQMAEGLQAAHSAGIIHTDFKSSNVMLVPDPGGAERAVIMDFGLARSASGLGPGGPTFTHSLWGNVAGTLAYMSPEQLAGGALTPASDIYSFGIVLFEMATGKLPFDDRHLIHSAMQRVSGEVDVRALSPEIDRRWEAVIIRCLHKDPEKRFASAADLADWFHQRVGVKNFYKYWTRRDWVRAGTAAGAVSGLSGGALYWLTRPYDPRPEALEWYRKGQSALHSMTYEAARKALGRAVMTDPKFALAHASLARAYDEMEYSDQAKEIMLRAMTVAQETRLSRADRRKLDAYRALVARDYDRAKLLFSDLESSARAGEQALAAVEIGWLAEKRDETPAAAKAYSRAVELDPSYAAAKLRLGFILGRRGEKDDLAAALDAFAEAESLYAASSDYEGVTETLLQRANLLNRRSRASEALPVIERALGIATTIGNRYQEVRLRLLLGAATRNAGDAARAAGIARRAIEIAQNEHMENLAASGMVDLASAYLQRGDIAEAEPLFLQALDLAERAKVRRQEARARAMIGSLYEQQDRPEEAQKYIDSALPFFREAGYRRDFAQAAIVLGGILRQRGDYEKAARVLTEAAASAAVLQDRRSEAQARGRLAETYRESGDWPAALLESERAARLSGSSEEAVYYVIQIAGICWLLGHPDEASQRLAEGRALLRAHPLPREDFEAGVLEIRRLYAEQDWQQTQVALGRLPVPAGSQRAAAQVGVLRSAIEIRRSGGARGLEQAQEALKRLDDAKLSGEAAEARLLIAEALAAVGKREAALGMLENAFAFLEPRQVWESLYRGRLIASRASVDQGENQRAARLALDGLRKLWPASAVETYLRRPDIQRLGAPLRF
jgi:serine/threonine protein kinase/tetratricopeptide (TPR) repeat protein